MEIKIIYLTNRKNSIWNLIHWMQVNCIVIECRERCETIVHTFARLSGYMRDEHVQVNIVHNMVILVDQCVQNGFVFITNIRRHAISRCHFGNKQTAWVNQNMHRFYFASDSVSLISFGFFRVANNLFKEIVFPTAEYLCTLDVKNDKLIRGMLSFFTTKKRWSSTNANLAFEMVDNDDTGDSYPNWLSNSVSLI